MFAPVALFVSASALRPSSSIARHLPSSPTPNLATPPLPPPPQHHQVTWRRMPTETYSTFVCRILGWAPELTAALNRTHTVMLVAKALVRGHDPTAVPKPPLRI